VNFSTPVNFTTPFGFVSVGSRILAADMDGDSKLDLAYREVVLSES
jgi:hypothetical protein